MTPYTWEIYLFSPWFAHLLPLAVQDWDPGQWSPAGLLHPYTVWKTLKNSPVLTIATSVCLVALPCTVLRKNQCFCCFHDLQRTMKKMAWELQQSERMFTVPWKVFSDMQLISKFSISYHLQNIAQELKTRVVSSIC